MVWLNKQMNEYCCFCSPAFLLYSKKPTWGRQTHSTHATPVPNTDAWSSPAGPHHCLSISYPQPPTTAITLHLYSSFQSPILHFQEMTSSHQRRDSLGSSKVTVCLQCFFSSPETHQDHSSLDLPGLLQSPPLLPYSVLCMYLPQHYDPNSNCWLTYLVESFQRQ